MKWEYKTIKISISNFLGKEFELKEFDKFVNQFGQIGWELVSTKGIINGMPNPVTTEIVLFFKRPLAE